MTPAAGKASDKVQELQALLQDALAVEHATIPPYLAAWLSVKEGQNREAAEIVRSVLLEEMLHLAQVANLLNAVGGTPSLTAPGFVPDYPHALPYSAGTFVVGIEKLSAQSIDTFMKIERPAPPEAPPEPGQFHTIGQFYEAVEALLREACEEYGEPAVFGAPAALQLGPEQYYGSGKLVRVTGLETALRAIREIVDQGEGAPGCVFDDDRAIHSEDGREPAHYYRFDQIRQGRLYVPGDTPKSGPQGPELPFEESGIYDIRANTKLTDYAAGSPVRAALERFAATYGCLLKALEDAFRGQPDRMKDGIAAMFALKYEAAALMRTPSGFSDGKAVGLTFEQGDSR